MAVYACSDLHAQYDLWDQIKNFVKMSDTLYILGDVVDRGYVGLEILNEVLNIPNIIFLRGNHEDFISSIGPEIIRYDEYDFDKTAIYMEIPNLDLWYMNGGEKTIEAFNKLSKIKKTELINKIINLSTHKKYINTKGDVIYLSHAGSSLPNTKEIVEINTRNLPINNYVWDRSHIAQLHWNGKDNEYCVHGHTPVGAMRQYIHSSLKNISINETKMYQYCDGHKINIDLGSFYTH